MAEQTLAGPGPQAAPAPNVDLIASEQFASTASGSTRLEPQYSTCSRRAAFASIASAQPDHAYQGFRISGFTIAAGPGLTQSSTDRVRGNHMDQSSRRVLWSAGSLPCCARAALAYTRMLSKPSRAPRRRNFEWRVFTPPKKTRLSSDCSGRRRKVGLDRDRARSPRPTLMQLPRLGACPSSVCHACPAAPIRSRATPSARR